MDSEEECLQMVDKELQKKFVKRAGTRTCRHQKVRALLCLKNKLVKMITGNGMLVIKK